MNKSQVQRLRVLFGQLSARKEEITARAQVRAIEMLPESEQLLIIHLIESGAPYPFDNATEPEREALKHYEQVIEGDEFRLEVETIRTAEVALRAIGVLYGQV